MKDMNRRGFLGLAGAAAAVGVSACAGGGGTTASSGGASGSASSTISFWSNHPANGKEVEQKLCTAFEAANPGLKVQLVDGGASYEELAQKFNAALAGGDVPDVVLGSDVTWFNLALNKQLEPLDPLLASAKIDTSDYVKTLYDDYLFNGSHYALPYARSTPLFYYNKELWSAAGLPDRGPKTWDEFKEWGPQLTKSLGADKTPLILADGAHYLDWYFENMVWSMGGTYSKDWTPTFSDPKTVAAGKFLQSLAQEKLVRFNKAPATDFGAGLSACMLESTGQVVNLAKVAKFTVGTAFLPTPTGTKACPTGGAGIGIPAKISAERKANALKFISFITNPQSTITFTQALGYMPVRTSALNEASEKAYLKEHPNSQTAVNQLAVTRKQDQARVFVPGGGARIGAALDKIVQGADVAATFKALDTATQQAYDTQVKPRL
jgi:sn-glycerol 3-phosphate transport system substrate-binding protein